MNIETAGQILTEACYGGSKAAGWHNDIHTGEPRTAEQNDALFPTRIALCHSELSEALEGHRRDLEDEHIAGRLSSEIELADAVIRIFDLAGAMGYELGSAIEAKLAYNAQRVDHRHAHRVTKGGKKY